MNADIRIFIDGIREKTGIDFSVYDEKGKFIAGNGNAGDSVKNEVDGIISDKLHNRTLFSIKYKNKSFIGRIDGATTTQRNYAYLISELAENSFFKESGLSRMDFCKAILMGETNHSQIMRYMRKYAMHDMPAFVMVLETNQKYIEDVKNILTSFSADGMDFVVKVDDDQLAYVKFIDDVSEEYQSSAEYAQFVKQFVMEEISVNIQVSIGGTVRTISDLSMSFNQALVAVRMRKAMNSKGEIHSFKEYVLIRMLEDLPKYKLNENLEMLMDTDAKEIFEDAEMINTAEEFLENNLNISETSRKLYVHRNTLTYRLDKIEKSTGLNIRNFSDAVTFRLITILSRLIR